MERRAFIHVGLPKCGSSSLQTRLTSGRDKALREGVLYPVPKEVTSDNGAMRMGHMLMASQLARLSRKASPQEPSILATYVDQFHASGAHTLALSSESLAKRLGRIRPELLSPLKGFAVEILLIYRRADALVLSSFKQAVRRKRYTGTFPEFAAESETWHDGMPDIPKMLDGIVSRLPQAKLHVVDLDAPGEKRDSIALAAALLGLPMTEWETTGLGPRNSKLAARGAAVNASHSDEKTLFLIALNRTDLDEKVRREVDISLSALPDEPIGSGTIMNRSDSRTLLRRFATLNADLAGRHGLPVADHAVNMDLPQARRGGLTAGETAVITEQLLPLLSAEAASGLKAVLR